MAAGTRVTGHRRVLVALIAMTAVAIALRLIDLDGRMAHWDEARVAYWTLRYHELGVWEYHPVVHGPFLFHVNEFIFGLIGPDDVSMRLIVALIAGAAPLAAWLYRDHLEPIELIALAGFLTVNPVLLYYGRFSRNDVMLAVVMLVAFGLLVRAHASGRSWYLYPAGAAIGLGFAMKENALLYLLCWAGAIIALLVHRVAYEHAALRLGRPTTPWALRETWRDRLPMQPRRWIRDGLLGVVAGVSVLVFFYAPRGTDDPGLGDLVTTPWRLPAVVEASVIEGARRLVDHWIIGSRGPAYLDSLEFYLEVIAAGALVVTILAIVGFLLEHRRVEGPRWLVIVALVWGLLSVGGYPYAGTINAPWLVAHMVVPLSIPAAVALGALVSIVIEGVDRSDLLQTVGAGLIVLAAVSLVLWPAYGLVYDDPTGYDNELVQYAQPGGDWSETIEQMEALAAANEGVDVLYVGDTFATDDLDGAAYKQAGAGWYSRLPLPWYTEAFGASTVSESSRSSARAVIDHDQPPVIIVTAGQARHVEGLVSTYELREHEIRHGDFDIHIYLDLDRLDDQ